MREYNYKSDFNFFLNVKTLLGDIPIDLSNDFEGELTSGLQARKFVFGNHGGELTNCTVEREQIHVICDNHGLGAGQLRLQFRYCNPNALYPDGVEELVANRPLDIRLTNGEAPDATPAEVDLLLPLVSASIYDIAVSKGYTGTQEQFYEAIGMLGEVDRRLSEIEREPALQPDFANVLENLEGLTPILEAIHDRLDDIEAKPAMQPDFDNVLENIEGLSPILESIFDRLDALEDELTALRSNTIDMEVTYTDDTTETIRLLRLPNAPAHAPAALASEDEEGGEA